MQAQNLLLAVRELGQQVGNGLQQLGLHQELLGLGGTLFSESNHFDSVLFIFDGGRRYKVSSPEIGTGIKILIGECYNNNYSAG